VLVITKRFNSIATWVINTILREEDVNKRALCVCAFIRIAEHLMSLQNFNGVMQVDLVGDVVFVVLVVVVNSPLSAGHGIAI
jgi:hypothetical protein